MVQPQYHMSPGNQPMYQQLDPASSMFHDPTSQLDMQQQQLLMAQMAQQQQMATHQQHQQHQAMSMAMSMAGSGDYIPVPTGMPMYGGAQYQPVFYGMQQPFMINPEHAPNAPGGVYYDDYSAELTEFEASLAQLPMQDGNDLKPSKNDGKQSGKVTTKGDKAPAKSKQSDTKQGDDAQNGRKAATGQTGKGVGATEKSGVVCFLCVTATCGSAQWDCEHPSRSDEDMRICLKNNKFYAEEAIDTDTLLALTRQTLWLKCERLHKYVSKLVGKDRDWIEGSTEASLIETGLTQGATKKFLQKKAGGYGIWLQGVTHGSCKGSSDMNPYTGVPEPGVQAAEGTKQAEGTQAEGTSSPPIQANSADDAHEPQGASNVESTV